MTLSFRVCSRRPSCAARWRTAGCAASACRPGLEGRIFTAAHLAESVRPITAQSSLPGYQVSDYPVLAQDKVRFVGEPLAVCVAPTRAQAEDLAATVQPDIEPLTPLPDAATARASAVRLHEHWRDNLFIHLKREEDLSEVAQRAAHVVTREFRMARQSMSPMEGKAVLAYWDDQRSQLVVYSSTQVPHMIRSGLAQCLGLELASLRVIAPMSVAASATSATSCPKRWRWPGSRSGCAARCAGSKTVASTWWPAPTAGEHHYRMSAYVDERGRLLGLDAEVHVDSGAYSVWPFTACLETGQIIGNLPGP
jgi:carbon-monoxide dehydrogenase large subunit